MSTLEGATAEDEAEAGEDKVSTMRWLTVRVEDYPGWLASLHAEAARRLDVRPAGEPEPSASYGVVGGRVRLPDGALAWLRVAPYDDGHQDLAAWTGVRDAASIVGVRKPELLARVEWTDKQHVPLPVAAELMTLVTDPVIQPGDQYLDHDPGLPDAWFADLRASLDALASHPTDRNLWWDSPERTGYAIHAAYGKVPDGVRPQWGVEHLDLHWGQVTAPEFWILDWEHWGVGIVGAGAARLYCTSLAVPTVAAKVHRSCADLLDSPSGRYAQLVIAADLLNNFAAYPDTADLAPALRALTRRLLSQ